MRHCEPEVACGSRQSTQLAGQSVKGVCAERGWHCGHYGSSGACNLLSNLSSDTEESSQYFGHVVLTNCLLPLLKRTAAEPGSDVRLVVVCPLDTCLKLR